MSLPKLLARLSRLTPLMSVVIMLPVVLVIGALDLMTGYQLGLSLFYLLPILVVAWAGGRRSGILFSILCAGVWLWVDLTGAERYSNRLLPFWNALIRLGFFVVTVLILSVFKSERELARTDPLTGIWNRHAFFERAALELERCRRYRHPVTVAYVDCDYFKRVNDRFGHESGDRLLKTVADILRSNTRTSDTIARLGGDEFAALLPETDAPSARVLLEKLRTILTESVRAAGWPTTFSIGAVAMEVPPDTVDEMVCRADDLMYEVKKSGKNALRVETAEPSGSART